MYILNRSPTEVIRGKTLFEAWHNWKLTVDHLKIFWSNACSLIEAENGEKFDKEREKYLFIGCN